MLDYLFYSQSAAIYCRWSDLLLILDIFNMAPYLFHHIRGVTGVRPDHQYAPILTPGYNKVLQVLSPDLLACVVHIKTV